MFAAPRVSNVLAAIDYIYPLVEKFKAGPPRLSASNVAKAVKRRRVDNSNLRGHQFNFDDDDEDSLDSDDEEDYDSDESLN